nr:MAG TPA_asm: hypothetical protein [Caudoviricetes sp.]
MTKATFGWLFYSRQLLVLVRAKPAGARRAGCRNESRCQLREGGGVQNQQLTCCFCWFHRGGCPL